MTREEIRAYPAVPSRGGGPEALKLARTRMTAAGQWHPGQAMGRRWAMGCVALEITQRCNLDCTLCYLSENAEAVHDVPLPELFRRIDMIHDCYGANTDVQVTGGEPTLRDRADLVAIIRHIRRRGLRPSLFTNGIRATRALLTDLAHAGLVDVAFHVDMTQNRQGYASEESLNALRRTYMERARGLGIAVIFNTTVFDGNYHQIAPIARFFVENANLVNFASFQLQAKTGRGIAGGRPPGLMMESVSESIRQGAGGELSFGVLSGGHRLCNNYGVGLVVNGRLYDLYDDPGLVERIFRVTAGVALDRRRPRRAALAFLFRLLLRRPALFGRGLAWLARRIWAMRRDLTAARGRVHKLAFFVHNFMDATGLDRERIDACAFMVATTLGPVPMCLHNAIRDSFVLDSVPVKNAEGVDYWNPLSGSLESEPRPQGQKQAPILPAKLRKGRCSGAACPSQEVAGRPQVAAE